MAIQVQGNGGVVSDVGGTTFRAGHVHIKPCEYGVLGHYQFSVRITSIAAMAAAARILELRNSGTNLLVLTKLRMTAIQTAAGTAQENGINCFRCTSFTAVDTTNTITPVISPTRTTMGASPGGAQIRTWNNTGTGGMTGGTLTKDATAFSSLPYNVSAAIATAWQWGPIDCVPPSSLAHPFVFAANEGFDIENFALNVTSYGITWYFDIAWAEVTAF